MQELVRKATACIVAILFLVLVSMLFTGDARNYGAGILVGFATAVVFDYVKTIRVSRVKSDEQKD